MDAVTTIKQHMDIDRLLEHYDFDHVHTDGEMIRSCCKIHGGNNPNAFVISRETGLWYCFTGGCGAGDMFTLVQKMEKIEFKDAVNWLANFYEIDINNLEIIERKPDYIKELNKFIKMMKGKKKVSSTEYHITEEIKEVTRYRNFTPETLLHFKLGFVDSICLAKRDGKVYSLQKRLVFPIIFDGIQVGLSLRRTRTADYPKWSHQPATLETANLLYNYDSCKSVDSVILCEGITDVWAFHELGLNAVATFGAHVTDQQYKLILKTGCSEVVLAYDGDDAGKKAVNKCIELFKHKVKISIIDFESNEDPESISRSELIDRYRKRARM